MLTVYRGMHGTAREQILYDPKELARMPRKHGAPLAPGELESRAFEMFDRGKDVRQVVIDLRVTSAEAWEIRERWIDATAQSRTAIEIDGDVHRDKSDLEIEDEINEALDAKTKP